MNKNIKLNIERAVILILIVTLMLSLVAIYFQQTRQINNTEIIYVEQTIIQDGFTHLNNINNNSINQFNVSKTIYSFGTFINSSNKGIAIIYIKWGINITSFLLIGFYKNAMITTKALDLSNYTYHYGFLWESKLAGLYHPLDGSIISLDYAIGLVYTVSYENIPIKFLPCFLYFSVVLYNDTTN